MNNATYESRIKFHKRFPPKQIGKNCFVDTKSGSFYFFFLLNSLFPPKTWLVLTYKYTSDSNIIITESYLSNTEDV